MNGWPLLRGNRPVPRLASTTALLVAFMFLAGVGALRADIDGVVAARMSTSDAARVWELSRYATEAEAAGRLSDASASVQQLIAFTEDRIGPGHPDIASLADWLGTLLYRQKRYTEAEGAFRNAIAIHEAAFRSDHAETATSLNNLGQALKAQGRNNESEAAHQRALAIREAALGPAHPQVATSLHNLALLYAENERSAEAEVLLIRALSIWRTLDPPPWPTIAIELRALGTLYKDAGRYGEALPVLREALSLFSKAAVGSDLDIHSTMSSLGQLHRLAGRYDEAEDMLRRVIQVADARSNDVPFVVATSLNELGLLYFEQGRYGEAEPLYRRAIRMLEVPEPSSNPELDAALGLSLNNLANLMVTVDAFEEAEDLYQRSGSILERTVGPKHQHYALHLTNVGEFNRLRGHPEFAADVLEQAAVIYAEALGTDHVTTAGALHNLALTYDALGRYEDAIRVYSGAASIRLAALGSRHPDTVGTLNNLAWSGLMSGRPEIGLLAARRALEGFSFRQHFGESEDAGHLRSLGTGSSAYVFSRSAWELFQSGDGGDELLDEAFRAAQQIGRQRAGDALARASARIAAGQLGLETAVDAWERAHRQRAALDRRFALLAGGTRAVSQEAYLDLARGAEDLDGAIDDAEALLRRDYPVFFDLVSPRPVDMSEIQDHGGADVGLLRDDEALVLLVSGATTSKGLVFVVTRDAAAWSSIPLTADQLSVEIAALRRQLDGGDMRGGFDRHAAKALYDSLFGEPAVTSILGSKSKWILVPQGPLVSLPFAALVTETPSGRDDDPVALRGTRWLGLERTLSVLPSASSLRMLRSSERPSALGTRPFFGLGDPEFRGGLLHASTPRTADRLFRGATGDVEAIRQLSRLPATRTEVLTIADQLGADRNSYLLGREATETNLRARALDGTLSEAKVVLLATHGLVAGEFRNLEQPALALSPPAQASDSDDGLLTASEAARLRLSADWLILSACNTAAGDSPGAEGLSGLARAFLYAGARSLLVSHWRVRDDAALRLTTRAVNAWQADTSQAGALRVAMRALMMDATLDGTELSFAHPAAWAAFTVIGVSR